MTDEPTAAVPITDQEQVKPGHLLDAQAAAERLGLSVRTVRRLIADGEIKVVRIGRAVRITEADLEAAIARWRD